MTIIEAIILGLLQGLSEFIPISSTAHMTIGGKLMDLIDPNNPEAWTAFMAVVQLGTLAAVFIYFAADIKNVPLAFIKENFRKSRNPIKKQSENSRMGWLIIISSVPVVIVGLLLKDIIEGSLTKDLYVISASLIILGIIMYIADKTANLKKETSQITIKDSILIGLAQCLALVPGASRSGTTITAGLFLGLEREAAARFSFLMSIPAIFGSGIMQFYQAYPKLNSDEFVTLSVATLVAGISGYASIAFLLKFLRERTTLLFSSYRVILGILLILLTVYNII
ncbi:MAG: undecaprenyl-diphosphate phosphatase [Candidatus Kapaibacteriales bacterium]